jgi:glyoxylase-like metal-dependent hydrolase (beta-lactamase superfamily II)/rhodanese-related sulfurtransferase
MIFEHISTGGCQSYLIGCPETRAAAIIDPEVGQIDHYIGLAVRDAVRVRYVIDTHTHADHFSASLQLARKLDAPTVMHRNSPAPKVDIRVEDGDVLIVGKLRLNVIHTPGHTRDSMCLTTQDILFSGDTLLIGGTGRTDLPSGDPEALYDSLFNRILKLDPALRVFPAHDYEGRNHSTIGEELVSNPRLQVRDRPAFVDMMRSFSFSMPTHLTEALRINMNGGQSVAQILSEAAATVPFMSLGDLSARVAGGADDLLILDVRERDAYLAGHIAGARHLPRGQLELRVNEELPDPTQRIVVCCELGYISTLAAATLRSMGFLRTVALDGGMKAWREVGYPLVVPTKPE